MNETDQIDQTDKIDETNQSAYESDVSGKYIVSCDLKVLDDPEKVGRIQYQVII